ncbi:MAG TPA: fused MFS/spermidine synthase [Micromonosporaceae bacterium]|nr:fused MFS/spermidine synthase [Micromonosporaceae bacterium]
MQTRPEPLPPWLAAAMVFLASGAVLVLEIVGLRLVGPYVGVTLQTSSAVIGVALAAIAYGAWLGGWLADRYPPRHLLAPALVLAAVTTAVTLPVVRYAGEILRGSAAAGVLLLTALATFVPCALLSTVPPLVVKLQLGDLGQTGRVVGRLSSIGTLGAITATLGTGFVLVAALPSSVIVLTLAVLLGAAGLALGWHLRRPAPAGLPGPARRTGPAGRTRAVVAVAGLAGAGLVAVAPDPCDVETAYHCARVVADPARPTGRLLVLNSARHSYVDLADPRHLEFEYVQWIGALADVLAPPARPLAALHLGGGGFTLPRYLAATRPGGSNVVLELDGELVELDRAELGLRDFPGLRVEVGDARVGLAGEAAGAYDLAVGDAFGHLVVPWHLATRELVTDVRRVLRPAGCYALNVIDYPPGRFVRAEVATVAAVFPYVALVAPESAVNGGSGANFVILGSAAPLPLAALRDRLAARAADAAASGGDPAAPGDPAERVEPVRVLAGAELAAFVGGARVLTDDHAPVDQLLARP